jgi:hypothetical protein
LLLLLLLLLLALQAQHGLQLSQLPPVLQQALKHLVYRHAQPVICTTSSRSSSRARSRPEQARHGLGEHWQGPRAVGAGGAPTGATAGSSRTSCAECCWVVGAVLL